MKDYLGRQRRWLTDYRNNGEDNQQVLYRWLGIAPREIERLESEAVLYNEGPVQLGVFREPASHFDPEFADRLGLPT